MNGVRELTCREVVELVTDYLDGAMAPEDRIALEEHLVYCLGCDVYLEQMRETIRLTGTLREEDMTPEALDELLLAFRDWKARSS